MDIIKYINDKQYFTCDFSKVERQSKSIIDDGVNNIKSRKFTFVRKRRLVALSVLCSLFAVIILIGSYIGIAYFNNFLDNKKYGNFTPPRYETKRIEYYEYFDKLVAYGPGSNLGELEMLYKTDIISENDKEVLREYEREIMNNSLYDSVGYGIGLGIKDGKDEIYLVCYPVYIMPIGNIKIWTIYPFFEEKKTFIFESNLQFSFEEILDYCEKTLIADGLSEEAEKIIDDYDSGYGSYYGGILLEINYNGVISAKNQEEYDMKKSNSDVYYCFKFGYYYGKSNGKGRIQHKTIIFTDPTSLD